jgi:hypothetical protein
MGVIRAREGNLRRLKFMSTVRVSNAIRLRAAVRFVHHEKSIAKRRQSPYPARSLALQPKALDGGHVLPPEEISMRAPMLCFQVYGTNDTQSEGTNHDKKTNHREGNAAVAFPGCKPAISGNGRYS